MSNKWETWEALSRQSWQSPVSPNDADFLEKIGVGCLQRVAKAVERLEQHVYSLTDEGREVARKRATQESRVDASLRCQRYLRRVGGPSPLTWARAWVQFYGGDEDYDSPRKWMRLCNEVDTRGVGDARRARLRSWIESHWQSGG